MINVYNEFWVESLIIYREYVGLGSTLISVQGRNDDICIRIHDKLKFLNSYRSI